MELESSPFEEPEEIKSEDEPENEPEPEGEGELEDESEDEPENEGESEDESEEDSEGTPEDESETDFEEQYNGVKNALHAEREKRQVIASELDTVKAELDVVKAQEGVYKEGFEKLVASLKADDLDEVVDIPKIEGISPEVIEARRMKDERQRSEAIRDFYSQVKTEADSISPDYSHLNLKDETQGVVLTHIITMLASEGQSIDKTVSKGMNILDGLIASVEKKAIAKTRIKPKPKPNSRTRQKTNDSYSQKVKKGEESGNFDAVFDHVIGGMSG